MLTLIAVLAVPVWTASASAAAPRCEAARIVVSLGGPVSEATGQNTLILRLLNRGPTCALDGYPRLVLTDRSGSIPFRVRDGGDQMITSRPPTSIVLRARAAAIVMINKYRCDRGERRVASRLRLALPGSPARTRALGLHPATAPARIGWCGYGDPGSTIDVTPFEPTVRAAGRR